MQHGAHTLLDHDSSSKLTLDRGLWGRRGSDIGIGLLRHSGGSGARDRSALRGIEVRTVYRWGRDVGGIKLRVRRVIGGVAAGIGIR